MNNKKKKGGDRMLKHVHNITDGDRHFVVDPISRTITTESKKLSVVQHDHDSERFTFEVPRYIEEHDMSESTRIEVHYSNFIRTKKERNDDVYVVTDVLGSRDKVYFSWLVSGNATRLVGGLSFSLTFICHDDANNVIYRWSTAVYESINVLEKHNNTETMLNLFPDYFEQMKQDIINGTGGGNTGGNTGGSGSEDEGETPSTGGVIDNVIEFDEVPPVDDGEFDNTVEF